MATKVAHPGCALASWDWESLDCKEHLQDDATRKAKPIVSNIGQFWYISQYRVNFLHTRYDINLIILSADTGANITIMGDIADIDIIKRVDIDTDTEILNHGQAFDKVTQKYA